MGSREKGSNGKRILEELGVSQGMSGGVGVGQLRGNCSVLFLFFFFF